MTQEEIDNTHEIDCDIDNGQCTCKEPNCDNNREYQAQYAYACGYYD